MKFLTLSLAVLFSFQSLAGSTRNIFTDTITHGSGVLSLPSTTDTLVGRATTDTLTNKTLTSPAMTSPSVTAGSLTVAPATGTATLALTPATATNAALSIATNTGGSFYWGLDNSTGGTLGLGGYAAMLLNTANTPMAFYTNSTERMRIAAAGGISIPGVLTLTSQPILSSLTASQGILTDSSKGLVSVALTGSGNLVRDTSPTLVTPALGTPTALVGTNITGTASGLTAGNVTTNANLTGPITSVGNATSIAAKTGTGTTFAMSASPTFTGTVGVATISATGIVATSSIGYAVSSGQYMSTGAAVSGQGGAYAVMNDAGTRQWSMGVLGSAGATDWTLYDSTNTRAVLTANSNSGLLTTSGALTVGGATTLSALTATTVPYLDASKALTSSSVTPTELGYLSGVSSAIQTQLGTKAPTASPTFTGTLTAAAANFSGDVAVATSKFTVASATGNTVAAGTLTSNGASITDAPASGAAAIVAAPVTGTNAALLESVNTGGTLYVGLDSSAAGTFGTGAYGAGILNTANTPLTLFTNSTARMTVAAGGAINTTGSFGIGAAPTSNYRFEHVTPTTVTGTVSTTGSTPGPATAVVTGVGTLFRSEFITGDTITIGGETQTISSITSDTSITCSANWAGTNAGATATRSATPVNYILPSGELQIGGTSASVSSNGITASRLLIVGTSPTTASTVTNAVAAQLVSYAGAATGGTGAPSYNLTRFSGTESTPQTIASGDILGRINFKGATTTSATTTGVLIQANTTQAWDSTSAGTQLLMYTTPNGSKTNTLALTLDQDQSATFAGAASVGSTLAVTGAITATGGIKGPTNLLISPTAPTITSGGCTSSGPAIAANNGPAAFTITVGTTCSGSQPIVVGMPTAATGWVCQGSHRTAATAAANIIQTSTSTTSVTFTNVTGGTTTAVAWTSGETLQFHCFAY